MNHLITKIAGRALLIGGISLLFVAYLNFVPTSLASDRVADYVKNHFVREVIFGLCLAAWTIRLAVGPINSTSCTKLAVFGSVVVLPFWVALLAGWSVGGMDEVWGGSIEPGAAYLLHGSQTILFYLGLALLWLARDITEP